MAWGYPGAVSSEGGSGAVRTVINSQFRDTELGVLALSFMTKRIIYWGGQSFEVMGTFRGPVVWHVLSPYLDLGFDSQQQQ